MVIRLLEPKDIPAVVNLTVQLLNLHRTFDPEYYQLEEDYTLKLTNWAEQHLNSTSQFIFVVEDNTYGQDRVIGFISGYIKLLFPWFVIKSVGHISFLAVDPAFQKRKIGKALKEKAEDWFNQKNLKYIEVYTNEKNEAGMAAWQSYEYREFNKFLRKKIGH